jgi:hypothetical protein
MRRSVHWLMHTENENVKLDSNLITYECYLYLLQLNFRFN